MALRRQRKERSETSEGTGTPDATGTRDVTAADPGDELEGPFDIDDFDDPSQVFWDVALDGDCQVA